MNFIEILTLVRLSLEEEISKFNEFFVHIQNLHSDNKLLNQSIDQKNNLLNKQFEKEAEANESIITSLTDQINADYEEINHNHEKLINIQKQVSIRYVEFDIFKKNRLKELIAAADELCIEIRKELHRKVDVNKYFELRKAHSQKVINFYSESAEKQKIYIDELLKGFE